MKLQIQRMMLLMLKEEEFQLRRRRKRKRRSMDSLVVMTRPHLKCFQNNKNWLAAVKPFQCAGQMWIIMLMIYSLKILNMTIIRCMFMSTILRSTITVALVFNKKNSKHKVQGRPMATKTVEAAMVLKTLEMLAQPQNYLLGLQWLWLLITIKCTDEMEKRWAVSK